jgi:RND family efflux transporter MFP subunit
MPVTTEAPGEIRFQRIDGRILRKGDRVKKGQLIAVLTNEDYVLGLRLESKRLAKEHAVKDHQEKIKLGEMGGIPPREVESAERNKIDTEVSYDVALRDLEKLKVKSPMAGILADLKALTEGQKVSSGMEIGKIMRFEKVRCELNITNDDIDKISIGQEVGIVNFAYEDETFTGNISKISPTIDPISRTFQVEVEINNADLKLRPGMFVKADIVIQKRMDAIRIPKKLLQTRNNKTVIFVVEEQVAKMKEVTTGLEDDTYVEILSGLNVGDRIVNQGFETLRDNSKVRVSR